MSSTLAWRGWIIGVASGCLQIYLWQRDRRIEPAKEQLFEEALRDRKGQFTEAQIHDLTGLVRRLERATREDIPRQARAVFLENQLQVATAALADGVRQYRWLTHEIEKLTGEATGIPDELSEAIRLTIKPHDRRRRLWRLVVLTISVFALVLALFPAASEFAKSLAESVFAQEGDYFFTTRRTVSYFAAVLAGMILIILSAGWRGRAFARKRPGRLIALAAPLFLIGTFIALLAEEQFYKSPEQSVFNWYAIVSACFFSVAASLAAMPVFASLTALFERTPLTRAVVADNVEDEAESASKEAD